jgi:hypothetical protein
VVDSVGFEPTSSPTIQKYSFTSLVNFSKLTKYQVPIVPSLLATVEGSLKWVAPSTVPLVSTLFKNRQLTPTDYAAIKAGSS